MSMLNTHKRLLVSLGVLAALLLVVFTVYGHAIAGNPFYPVANVSYDDASTGKQSGNATTPNSLATAWAYRSNYDNQFDESDIPALHKIYAATGGSPAYTSWDVGSTVWGNPAAVGDAAMIVLVTHSGLNGWNGAPWIGGAKRILPLKDVGDATAWYRDVVMEPIPTPTLENNTTSSIGIHWQGLWDNDTGAAGGAGPASVVGYTIYRSVDGGAYSSIGSAVQNAGSNISYTDSTTTNGHIYNYELGVRFEWLAHAGGYYEPATLGPASANLATASQQPVMLKFISTPPNFTAGTKSPVQTIQSSDALGNAIVTVSDTVVNLTTNSTGVNAKFYSVSGGVCTSTPITTVTILTGTSTAQFCYYDEKAASPWTLTGHYSTWADATESATVTSTSTLGSVHLAMTVAQKDRVAFTGVDYLTALDNFGNTMTSFSAAADNVTFTVSPGSAAVGGLSGAGANQLTSSGDFLSGIASLSARLKLIGTSGSYTVTATTVSGKSDSVPITLTGGSLDHFDVALASPQNVAATFTGTNTLTARDLDNNIITSFDASAANVTVAESGGSGTVTGLGSGNNNILNQVANFSSGVANLTGKMIYTGLVGSHVFKFTAGAVNSTSSSITFNPGSLAKFALNINSPQANAQAFSTATITAQDIFGNTVTNFDASADHVNIFAGGTGALNKATLTSNTDFVGGVADLSNSLIFTGQAGSHTITATSVSAKTGNVAVTITAGTATSAKIVDGSGSGAAAVGNTSIQADQTLSLWAAGYDTSGNWAGLISGDWSSTGSLAPSVSASSVNSIVFNPTTAPASGTISFTNGSLSDPTGTITITPGTLDHFIVSAPGTATAGQSFNVSITAKDIDGNTVTGFINTQSLSFSGPGNAANGNPPTYPANANFTSGVAASVPVTLFRSETVKLTAKQGSITGQSANIVVTGATSNGFTVNTPSTATAGTSFSAQITAYDNFGNVDQSYTGDHNLTFANPANAPDNTPPQYPASVNFAAGTGSADITLFKRETTTIKVTEASGTLTGTSGPIAVDAGSADNLTKVSGDNQSGPVSQVLPQPLVVIVKDVYGNPVPSYGVNFSITIGGGSLGAASVNTASDGTARTTWALGTAPGTDNNTARVSAISLSGSPIDFTASANGNGFVISVPASVTAGVSFPVSIKVVDINGVTVQTYGGTKTLTFSGPSNGPNGTPPQYPVSVDFVNGVAQPQPNITLAAAETTTLNITDGTLSGTSVPFAVSVGAPAKLSIISAPQQLNVGDVSSAITVCLQDQYGNSLVNQQSRTLNLSVGSPGGQFSINPSGPWTSYTATFGIGMSCMDVYYKDAYAGAKTIAIASGGLSEADQPVSIAASTAPPPPTENQTGNSASTTETKVVTVYVDHPTTSTTQPSTSPTVDISLPTISFPVITSPAAGAFIAPIDGNIVVEGTAPIKQTVRILSATGTELASVTSDQYGQWRALIDQSKFSGAQQDIYAELVSNRAQSPLVAFAVKQPTLLEKFINFIRG